MTSVVGICNNALDKLGQSAITSLSDGNKAANLCSRNWEKVRDQVLRDHPWNFAVKRATLAASTDAPDWGFDNQFPLPSDSLRLLEVRDLRAGEYQLENGSILSNETVLYVRYITRIEDPNDFDSLFIDAVATRLAFELCEGLTQSNTKKEALWQEYGDSLTRAKKTDAQENPPVLLHEDSWVESRY